MLRNAKLPIIRRRSILKELSEIIDCSIAEVDEAEFEICSIASGADINSDEVAASVESSEGREIKK